VPSASVLRAESRVPTSAEQHHTHHISHTTHHTSHITHTAERGEGGERWACGVLRVACCDTAHKQKAASTGACGLLAVGLKPKTQGRPVFSGQMRCVEVPSQSHAGHAQSIGCYGCYRANTLHLEATQNPSHTAESPAFWTKSLFPEISCLGVRVHIGHQCHLGLCGFGPSVISLPLSFVPPARYISYASRHHRL
jgi:hypothetical protein